LASATDYSDADAERLASEELAWADSALAAPFRYRFVVLHHPPASGARRPEDWNTPATRERRARLLEICRNRDVTAILAGHEHLYARERLQRGSSSCWQITTGGAGAPLVPARRARVAAADAGDVDVAPGTIVRRSVWHYCRLVIPRAAGAPRLTA